MLQIKFQLFFTEINYVVNNVENLSFEEDNKVVKALGT
jgi:hypothetical protein